MIFSKGDDYGSHFSGKKKTLRGGGAGGLTFCWVGSDFDVPPFGRLIIVFVSFENNVDNTLLLPLTVVFNLFTPSSTSSSEQRCNANRFR